MYERAFPPGERRPIETLLKRGGEEGDFIAFYDGSVFCGFANLLTWRDITHILYFAVDEDLRGMGYGTRALETIRSLKPENRILADIEVAYPGSGNNEQRIRRKEFYLRNGYMESGITYRWREESYEILVNGGPVSEDEFNGFWRHFDNQDKKREC